MTEPATAPRRLPLRLFIALVALAVLVVGGAIYVGATGSDDATIKVIIPGGGYAGATIPGVPNGRPFYTDTYAVCTPTGAPVTITSVDPLGATGPVNVDWAVHHGGFWGPS